MPLRNTDIDETIRRLRKHPVICMDGQNITNDAADDIERLQQFKEAVMACQNGGPPYRGWNITRLNDVIASVSDTPASADTDDASTEAA